MPGRRSGSSGGRTIRHKHSLGNLRRAHPASGATWNVQVVRGKMSSKCLWHACRALVLGITLLLLGAGMATIGYYADYLSESSELRGNATIRVKNDLKGFHLNNLSYIGPIVMGFGGFIVVASCVMTFEARDSAAKVVPARLRVTGNGKTVLHSNPSSGASQRKTTGIQLQSSRWDQNIGVFRSSPVAEAQKPIVPPFDREALTADLIKFSKFLSATARFSPQLRHHTLTGSVPNISTCISHPFTYSTNISNLLPPHHKSLLLMEQKRYSRHLHHHHYHQIRQQHQQHIRLTTTNNLNNTKNDGPTKNHSNNTSGRQLKHHSARISTSLIQRQTRKSTSSMVCSLLQPPYRPNKLYWHAASFDDTARLDKHLQRMAERTKRSSTSKKHVLARQKPVVQQEEDKIFSSPLGKRRSSIMSDSAYTDRWTTRAASIASRASSIDSRRIQVDLHSPEVIPKSILRSPKRYNSGPSATSSIEKEFRSQLSVCSEPPTTLRQLSGQSSLEPCLPEENVDILTDEGNETHINSNKQNSMPLATTTIDTIPSHSPTHVLLQRSNSTRTHYDETQTTKQILHKRKFRMDQHSSPQNEYELFDSEKVINERRCTLLKANSETALNECKFSGNLELPELISEKSQHTSIDIDANGGLTTNKQIILQIDFNNTMTARNEHNTSEGKV